MASADQTVLRRDATLILLAFAMLIVSIDAYIVVLAFSAIGYELGFRPSGERLSSQASS